MSKAFTNMSGQDTSSNDRVGLKEIIARKFRVLFEVISQLSLRLATIRIPIFPSIASDLSFDYRERSSILDAGRSWVYYAQDKEIEGMISRNERRLEMQRLIIHGYLLLDMLRRIEQSIGQMSSFPLTDCRITPQVPGSAVVRLYHAD